MCEGKDDDSSPHHVCCRWQRRCYKREDEEHVPLMKMKWQMEKRERVKLILKTGFFHVAPHRANISIDSYESLFYYDFGMTGKIKSFTREKLMDLFFASSQVLHKRKIDEQFHKS